jgi:hypothetical protein
MGYKEQMLRLFGGNSSVEPPPQSSSGDTAPSLEELMEDEQGLYSTSIGQEEAIEMYIGRENIFALRQVLFYIEENVEMILRVICIKFAVVFIIILLLGQVTLTEVRELESTHTFIHTYIHTCIEEYICSKYIHPTQPTQIIFRNNASCDS